MDRRSIHTVVHKGRSEAAEVLVVGPCVHKGRTEAAEVLVVGPCT